MTQGANMRQKCIISITTGTLSMYIQRGGRMERGK